MELAYAPPFSSAKDPVNVAGFVAENILAGRHVPFYAEDVKKIPENAFRLDEVDLTRPIYITCQAGLRGYVAQRMLVQHGAKEVYNLSGGYTVYGHYIKDLAGLSDDSNVDCSRANVKELCTFFRCAIASLRQKCYYIHNRSVWILDTKDNSIESQTFSSESAGSRRKNLDYELSGFRSCRRGGFPRCKRVGKEEMLP